MHIKIKKIIFNITRLLFSKIFNFLIGLTNYIVIFRVGEAIGDHVYMSSIIREINLNKKKNIILFTNHYKLFANNLRIKILFKIDIKSYIWFFLDCLKGKNILEFNSIHIKKDIRNHFLKYHKNNKMPLAQAMSEHFNLDIDYSNLKNEFYFDKLELLNYEKKFFFLKNFSLIHSTTKKTFTLNKEWKLSGLQKIIDSFQDINWVQIGTSNEPKLRSCKHLLNISLRETAYLIYKSNFIISYEGLFNHLAACFDKKNFLIHTGFLHENSINYNNNIIISENKRMKCYPCFDLDCKDHQTNFISKLSEEKVINIIKENK